jgi:integrase
MVSGIIPGSAGGGWPGRAGGGAWVSVRSRSKAAVTAQAASAAMTKTVWHLSLFVGPEADALIFPGVRGGPLRRSNFNKMSAWPHAVRAIGAEGLHFHDLRHTGNHFAAASGASLKDLMARMGHDSERAAIIYQHEARGADLVITSAIDAHIETATATQGQHHDGTPGSAAQAR